MPRLGSLAKRFTGTKHSRAALTCPWLFRGHKAIHKPACALQAVNTGRLVWQHTACTPYYQCTSHHFGCWEGECENSHCCPYFPKGKGTGNRTPSKRAGDDWSGTTACQMSPALLERIAGEEIKDQEKPPGGEGGSGAEGKGRGQ